MKDNGRLEEIQIKISRLEREKELLLENQNISIDSERYNFLANFEDLNEANLNFIIRDKNNNVVDNIDVPLSIVQVFTIFRTLGVNEFLRKQRNVTDISGYTDEDLIEINNILLNQSNVFDYPEVIDIKKINNDLKYAEDYYE